MPLNCTLRNGENSKFVLCLFYRRKENERKREKGDGKGGVGVGEKGITNQDSLKTELPEYHLLLFYPGLRETTGSTSWQGG